MKFISEMKEMTRFLTLNFHIVTYKRCMRCKTMFKNMIFIYINRLKILYLCNAKQNNKTFSYYVRLDIQIKSTDVKYYV